MRHRQRLSARRLGPGRAPQSRGRGDGVGERGGGIGGRGGGMGERGDRIGVDEHGDGFGDGVGGRGGGMGECGLMTLEWLLIVAAVAGFAAVMAYVVQRVVEDEVDVVDDPTVMVLDAEIAAAFVAEEAYEAALREAVPDPGTLVARFKPRCEQLATGDRFRAVVVSAEFKTDGSGDNPYRCVLMFRNLAGP